MTLLSSKSRRVLVADDDANILDAYRRVLDGLTFNSDSAGSEFDDLSAELFGESEPTVEQPLLSDVIYCRQGEQAVRDVSAALASGQPFSIVFLDMRMPPGIDGLETAAYSRHRCACEHRDRDRIFRS